MLETIETLYKTIKLNLKADSHLQSAFKTTQTATKQLQMAKCSNMPMIGLRFAMSSVQCALACLKPLSRVA